MKGWGVMEKMEKESMTLYEMTEPINIEKSVKDSRNLIMPHQQEAVEALSKYYQLDKNIENRNGLLVMPTGSGKTYTAVNWLLSEGVAKGYRVVWLVHRQELVEQTFQEFRKQAPLLKGTRKKKLHVFPVSGAHMHMSTASKSDVYVCSIASVANDNGYRFIARMVGEPGKKKLIIVIDEAHHSISNSYTKVINRMTCLNPNRVLLGLTATPTRMMEDQKKRLLRMYNAEENIQNNIGVKGKGYVFEVTLKQLLVSGFLAKPIYIPVETKIMGEIEYGYTPKDEEYFLQFGELSVELKNKIGKSSARNAIIVNQYLEHQKQYGKTIIFAYDQNHAETLCNEFKDAGVSCDYAISDRTDSQEVIRKFKDNQFDVLINVQILTEGSDVPDIQTVFLARETNSDSLLMQMIGRALRGEKAGGTKEAYVVAFHDTWDKFAGMMDPGELDIFDAEDDLEGEEEFAENVTDEEEEKMISPNEEKLKLLEQMALGLIENDDENQDGPETDLQEGLISKKDLYMKLYKAMRASLVSEEKEAIIPCGWYSVINHNGENEKLLVLADQKKYYDVFEKNIGLLNKEISADAIRDIYFSACKVKPDSGDLRHLLNYVISKGEMPAYFDLSQNAAFKLKEIGESYKKVAATNVDEDIWLKDLYESAPVLQQIYHYFYAFKKSVLDAIQEQREATIIHEDERVEYEVVENYYDLNELLEEIKEQYPKLRTDGIVKLGWSEKVVRQWYALCERYPDNGRVLYQIYVNKIFSSPNISRETVKYLLFHELLHRNGYWSHDDEFRKREWQYPDSDKWDSELDRIYLDYHMEEYYKNSVANEIHMLSQEDTTCDDNVTDAETQDEGEVSFNPTARGIQAGFKYCRNCGNKLPEDSRFCDKCGSRVEY